jgi:hypothetical protein
MSKYPIHIENHLEIIDPVVLDTPWVIWGASEHLKEEFFFDSSKRLKNLFPLYRFSTIQGFYPAYQLAMNAMARFVIMREGTQPIWEDISHIYGAHWSATFGLNRMDYQDRILDCVLSMLGETFTNELYDSKKITGITIINTPQLHQFRLWLTDDRTKLTVRYFDNEYKELFGWETRQDVTFSFSPFRCLATKFSGDRKTIEPQIIENQDQSDGWSTVKGRQKLSQHWNRRY